MATIYNKLGSDKCLILAPREGFLRKFDFSTWSEIRLGFYFTGVTSGGDDTACGAETVTLNTAADRLTVGLKNTDTNDLPGFGSSVFIGAMAESGSTSTSAAAQYFSGASGQSRLVGGGYIGTTLIGGTSALYPFGGTSGLTFASAALTSGYNGFWALKYVLNGRGTSSQSITMTHCEGGVISGTDYSASALRIAMNNGSYTIPQTIPWTTGGVPNAIPDGFWIRMPFYNNRLRLSCIRAIRYA